MKVSNFPVEAGDTIFVLVFAPEPQLGYVSFLNISKGHHTSVAINARPDIQSLGASAEWIVEMVSPDNRRSRRRRRRSSAGKAGSKS